MNSPNVLGSFGSCVATVSPFFATFSTSEVIDFKLFHTVDTLKLSLSLSSCGVASLAQFSIEQLFKESKVFHSDSTVEVMSAFSSASRFEVLTKYSGSM